MSHDKALVKFHLPGLGQRLWPSGKKKSVVLIKKKTTICLNRHPNIPASAGSKGSKTYRLWELV